MTKMKPKKCFFIDLATMMSTFLITCRIKISKGFLLAGSKIKFHKSLLFYLVNEIQRNKRRKLSEDDVDKWKTEMRDRSGNYKIS